MFDPIHNKTHTPKNNNKNNKYLSYGVLSFDSKTKNKDLKFNNMVNDNDHGLCSPPLWRTSPTRMALSHTKRPLSPESLRSNYRNMSPESKAEAVARGQKELMDMVKNMPESCYELTLKDLVEQQQQKGVEEEVKKVKNVERKSVVKMSESGGGYLLKMGGFPFRSKKTRRTMTITRTKVSPRPSVDGSGNREREWWKIGSGSKGSSAGTGSRNSNSNSNSSSTRSSKRKSSKTSSCWSFLWTKRSEKGE